MARWQRCGVVALFIYAMINFRLLVVWNWDGQPARVCGQHVLKKGGEVVRVISPQEYHERYASVVRGLFAFWMLFHAAIGASWWSLRSGLEWRSRPAP